MRKYVSGCAGLCDGKISDPRRSLGNGARRWAYSKGPKFSGLVALEVPTCAGLTARWVFPRRRSARSSSSAAKISSAVFRLGYCVLQGANANAIGDVQPAREGKKRRPSQARKTVRKRNLQGGDASGRIRGLCLLGRDRMMDEISTGCSMGCMSSDRARGGMYIGRRRNGGPGSISEKGVRMDT